MFLTPTREQREHILGHISNYNEGINSLWSPFVSGATRAGLASNLVILYSGDQVLLFQPRTLKKMGGTARLRGLVEILKDASPFDYHFFRDALTRAGLPETLAQDFMGKQFLESADEKDIFTPGRGEHACTRELSRSAHGGPVHTLFVSLSESVIPHCHYWFPGWWKRDESSKGPSHALREFPGRIRALSSWSTLVLSAGKGELSRRRIVEAASAITGSAEKSNFPAVIALIHWSLIDGDILAALKGLKAAAYILIDEEGWKEEKMFGLLRAARSTLSPLMPLIPLPEGAGFRMTGIIQSVIEAMSVDYVKVMVQPALCSPDLVSAGAAMAREYVGLFRSLRDRGIKEMNFGPLINALVREETAPPSCGALSGGQETLWQGGSHRHCPHAGNDHPGAGPGDSHHRDDKAVHYAEEKCLLCPARGLCSGGCRYLDDMSVTQADSFHCGFLQHLVLELLGELCAGETGKDGGSHAC